MKKSICLLLFYMHFFVSDSQVLTDSLLIDNHYRTFHFNPPQKASKNYRLIFILHGSGGDGKGMMKPASNLEKRSADESILLVYPDGYKRYWNECRNSATSVANLENINEQAFFDSMVYYFSKRYGVNDQYFFAIGMSGGGHMTYKLALTRPGRCKAISAVVANLPDTNNLDCAESKKPVAVMIINGTKDPVNPYNGGEMMVSGSSYGYVRSTANTFNYWARLAGYKGQPLKEELPDTDTANQQTITRYTFTKKGRPEITLLKVTGGEHACPTDIDAFIESWKFFKRQIKETAASGYR